jgi:hypothetical protein
VRETSDIRPKYVAYFFAGLILLAVVIHIAMWWMLETFARIDRQSDVVRSRLQVESSRPPDPRLQVDPVDEYHTDFERQSRLLNEFGWVDQGKGVARIPIDRAMEMVLERGLK